MKISHSIVICLAACTAPMEAEDGADDSFAADGKADGGYSMAETAGALRVANELDLAELDGDAGLSARAAANIVEARAGTDGVDGTNDDTPFATLAELDAVPYVGPVTLGHLVDHARTLGWIAGIAPLQRLRPTQVVEGDDYATGIAQSGSWLAVAAPKTNNWRGVVYMYFRDNGQWQLASTIESPHGDDDAFGAGLEMDDSTMVISSRRLNADETGYVGHVHVYALSGTSWSHQLEVAGVSGPLMSGNTWIVRVEDKNATGGARVDVYRRSGATWTKAESLFDTTDVGVANVRFARSLALNGETIAVATTIGFLPARDGNDRRPINVVDVYTRTGTGWTSTRLQPSATSAEYSGDFGSHMAIDGNTLVIGSYLADGATGLQHAGSATVFVRSGSTWQQQALLHSTAPIRKATFGSDLAISGDSLVIGAPTDGEQTTVFPYTTETGAVYLFERSGSTWTATERVANTTPYSGFAHGLSLQGATLVIGAWQDRGETGPRLGYVYAN